MEKREFIYKKIENYLLELIEKEKNNNIEIKLPSENFLSKKFATSRVSAKRAISELESNGLIYSVQGKGTFIKKQIKEKSYKLPDGFIALIVPDLTVTHIVDIITAINKFFNNINYPVMIFDSNLSQEMERKHILNAIKRKAVGMLIYPVKSEQYNTEILKLRFDNFPIILLDRKLNGINIPCVSSNHFKIGYDATNYLINNGHKNIAMFQNKSNLISSLKDRETGYTKALLENKLNFSPDNLLHFEENDSIYNTIDLFLKNHKDITGIISLSGKWGIELIHYLTENNLLDKIEIIFFDYEHRNSAPLIKKHYAIVKQNCEKIGTTACQLLVDMVLGEGSSFQNVYIPIEIISNNK